LKFQEFVLEEGELWDAVRVGVKAFREKRQEQKSVTQEKKLTDKILTAEGGELRKLVKQIVDKGLTVKDGEVVKPERQKTLSKEFWNV